MIHIKDKSLCSGCSACANKCPRKCITLQADDEGFLYPVVDKDKCIDCGLCEKVCHIRNPYNQSLPIRTLAAKNNNEKVRSISSSGGFFTAVAHNILENNGVVFGVKFDKDWNPVYSYAETKEGISDFRGSKYVQAQVGDCYKTCLNFLKQHRNVLFCGTPCQIAALYHFLGNRYSDLLTTIDFVCHGVPSPQIWSNYLNHTISIYFDKNGYEKAHSRIYKINFRDKRESYHNFHITIESRNSEYSSLEWEDPYMQAFLYNYSLRPSCYNCHARNGRASSDITMGDCWGINKISPEFADDKGISLIMTHTDKGDNLIDNLDLCINEISFESACGENPAIIKDPIKPNKRNKFFRLLNKGKSITEANSIVNQLPIVKRLVWSIKRKLHLS